MTAPRVRADYDALRQMAADWRQQANDTARSLQQIRSQFQTLESGDWVGKGATAFFGEMNSQVLPTLKRLADALSAAGDTTQQISQLMKTAEDEAAKCFQADGAGALGGIGAAVAAAAAGLAGGAAAAGGVASKVGDAVSGVVDDLTGGGGSAQPASGGSGSGGTTPPPIGKTTAEKAAAVKKLIDAGKKQEAIDEAIRQYGVDTSSAKTGTPKYDSATSGEGGTTKDRTIKIGDDAFSSPGWLASSIGHEHVHAQQAADRWYTGPQGTLLNEVEAYDWEIKNASRFGLTANEVKELEKRRKEHYDGLNADIKKIVDGGSYKLPDDKKDT
jgi:WXG100 family type VII secretion target